MGVGGKISNELQIVRKHFKRIYIRAAHKQLSFHTEAIFKEKVWKKVQEFVLRGNKAVWFVLTPVNYDFAKLEHGFRGTRHQYEKIILPRYRWLQEHGQEIQLHLHIRPIMFLFDSEKDSYREQSAKFKSALSWMEKNGFEVNKIVFGWWAHDKVSEKLCKKYNIKIINEFDYIPYHDWDLMQMKLGK